MLVTAIIAVIIAIPLLIRDYMAPKTRFAPDDITILERALSLDLPDKTELELGYYNHGAGDWNVILRSEVSVKDAQLLRNRLTLPWAETSEIESGLHRTFLEGIDAEDRFHSPTPRTIDMIFSKSSDAGSISVVFCKSTSDRVCIYFCFFNCAPDELIRLVWW